MVFLKKLFNKSPDYPSLPPDHGDAMVLVNQQKQLRSLLEETKDSLEILPGRQRSFVLVGKPPKKFGLFWIEKSAVFNLVDVAKKTNIPGPRLHRMIDNIREAYKQCPKSEKYVARLGEGKIVVTPSRALRTAVATAVREGVPTVREPE